MIKSIYFPSKTFASNEENILDIKKANIYKGCDKSQTIGKAIFTSDDVTKGIGFTTKNNFIYPIISTTKYMDSHDDVHFDGCFTKTVNDQQGKVYYCADHDLSLKGIVAAKKDVEMVVKNIDWSIVGKDYQGQTQALIFCIDKSSIKNQDALSLIESDPELENSIRMQYVKVMMGIDSKDKMYAVNKQYFDSRINEISNTRIYQETTEPTKVTHVHTEPPNGTQNRPKTDYSKIKFI